MRRRPGGGAGVVAPNRPGRLNRGAGRPMAGTMDTQAFLPTREAVVSPLNGRHFRLLNPASAHPLTPILFSNRKAARNWAFGRGYLVREYGSGGGR